MFKKTISMVLMACFLFSFTFVAILSADDCQKTKQVAILADTTAVEDVVNNEAEAAESNADATAFKDVVDSAAEATESNADEAKADAEKNVQEVAEEATSENPAKSSS